MLPNWSYKVYLGRPEPHVWGCSAVPLATHTLDAKEGQFVRVSLQPTLLKHNQQNVLGLTLNHDTSEIERKRNSLSQTEF